LTDTFPIHDGLKQGDALSPQLFNFALEYAIRKVHENQVGLNINGTHQFLVYDDDDEVFSDKIITLKINKETLIDASEVSLEINTR
jgi:hypothetical protein